MPLLENAKMPIVSYNSVLSVLMSDTKHREASMMLMSLTNIMYTNLLKAANEIVNIMSNISTDETEIEQLNVSYASLLDYAKEIKLILNGIKVLTVRSNNPERIKYTLSLDHAVNKTKNLQLTAASNPEKMKPRKNETPTTPLSNPSGDHHLKHTLTQVRSRISSPTLVSSAPLHATHIARLETGPITTNVPSFTYIRTINTESRHKVIIILMTNQSSKH